MLINMNKTIKERSGIISNIYFTKNGLVERKSSGRGRFSLYQFVYEAFLPSGFPESVSPDYVPYQIWDSLQAGASSLNGILSSRAILASVGVGKDNATPTAAVIQWIIKDGSGMIGRIIFGWVQGTDLDNNSKRWRLIADILNDLAFFLEILTTAMPDQLFLPLVCTGAVLKAIVGVSGGATRAALTQHQARRNNLADVSAKDGSQETAAGLLSLILGLFITPYIDSQTKTWICFILFTIIHLYTNYRAVASVILERLNRQRANIVIQVFLQTFDGKEGKVLTPLEVSKQEKIFYTEPEKYKIILGSPIEDIFDGSDMTTQAVDDLVKGLEKNRYFLKVSQRKIFVVYEESATQNDILKSYFEAQLVVHKKTSNISLPFSSLFNSFEQSLIKQGWNTTEVLLGSSEWRVKL